jgi:hypothetical protein
MPLPLTPLEHNIEEFEKAALEYHRLKTSRPVNIDERKKLDDELKQRLADLKQRKQRLKTQASVNERVQVDLAEANYRKERAIAQNSLSPSPQQLDMMDREPHHPAARLRKNMEAQGDLAPDDNCACHHIVQGKGKTRKDKSNPSGPRIQTQNAILARAQLHLHGIGINDASNGVYLPKRMKHVPHWRFPKALPHANIHTLAYEQLVYNTLEFRSDTQSIKDGLSILRVMLEQGQNTDFLTKKTQTSYLAKLEKYLIA